LRSAVTAITCHAVGSHILLVTSVDHHRMAVFFGLRQCVVARAPAAADRN
jgi:hypothetical protein